ncbi:MAG: hypothetical protein HYU97_03990 [Deltaproteobacteria bacterium]|nr:hypothetical protein [Deltaproteobacteria bacterium]
MNNTEGTYQPIIIAHRGYKAKAPENTLPAFHLAVQSKAKGVEFDVWRCGSGEIVVCHDRDVSLHSNGTGFITHLPLKKLREFNFAYHQPKWASKETLPTLEEVLEVVSPLDFINIEVKSAHFRSFGIEQGLAAILQNHPLRSKITISSFNPIILSRLKRKLPEIKRGLLLHRRQLPLLSRGFLTWWLKATSLHPPDYLLSNTLTLSGHRHGLKIYPYTVNSLEFLKKCVELRVDGLITDDPDWAEGTLCHWIGTMTTKKI